MHFFFSRSGAWKDLAHPSLAFNRWHVAQISPIRIRQVEGEEAWLTPMEEQIVELRARPNTQSRRLGSRFS
jgi:hypothetical protein